MKRPALHKNPSAIGQPDKEIPEVLVAHGTRGVTLAGCVCQQEEVPRCESPYFPIARMYLARAGEEDRKEAGRDYMHAGRAAVRGAVDYPEPSVVPPLRYGIRE